MKDIKGGIPPELAVVGRWRHQGMWELGSDSLLVIQMDIERDQGQKYRYLLKTGNGVITSPDTKLNRFLQPLHARGVVPRYL